MVLAGEGFPEGVGNDDTAGKVVIMEGFEAIGIRDLGGVGAFEELGVVVLDFGPGLDGSRQVVWIEK